MYEKFTFPFGYAQDIANIILSANLYAQWKYFGPNVYKIPFTICLFCWQLWWQLSTKSWWHEEATADNVTAWKIYSGHHLWMNSFYFVNFVLLAQNSVVVAKKYDKEIWFTWEFHFFMEVAWKLHIEITYLQKERIGAKESVLRSHSNNNIFARRKPSNCC